MLNAIEDTSKHRRQKVNDPAAMVLAVGRAQAVAQQNATWLNYGKVAEQALPVFRNVVEAVTYAMFPLFVLLLLLTSGRETMLAFKGLCGRADLDPALAAALRHPQLHGLDLRGLRSGGRGGPGHRHQGAGLQTASTIYSRAISGREAVVGYLAISIPFIAWAALKAHGEFRDGTGGRPVGPAGDDLGWHRHPPSATSPWGTWGWTRCNWRPTAPSAFMGSWQNDLSGNTFSSNALTGRTAVRLLRNQGFASRMVSISGSFERSWAGTPWLVGFRRAWRAARV